MHFSDIARNFSRPSVAALMGPLPMTAQTVFLGRSSAAHTVRSLAFQKTLDRVVHGASARNVTPAPTPAPPAVLPSPDPDTAAYTVRRGDTLSDIVWRALGPSSVQELYRAVALVAEGNGLDDPDLILTGQRLDLSMLDGAGGPAAAGERDLTAILAEIFGDNPPARGIEHGEETRWTPMLDGDARLSSHYGYRRDPFTGARDFHDGVDVAAKSGTPILAFRPGAVMFSGYRPGYGNMVVLRHDDGLESIYAHASVTLVSSGDWIDAGTPIARVGSTGQSTGPHVHFEVRRDGAPVDPMPHLERATRIQTARR